jgi:hypothetical protein
MTLNENQSLPAATDDYRQASTAHAADGRVYDERDYIDRTIATIRQHDPNALRDNWWTGAALALADEVDRLRSLVGEEGKRPDTVGELEQLRQARDQLVAWDERWPDSRIHSAHLFKQCHDELEAVVAGARNAAGRPGVRQRGPVHVVDAGRYHAYLVGGVPMIERSDTTGAVLEVEGA